MKRLMLVAACVVIAACGRTHSPTAPPLSKHQSALVKLLVAPWCTNCKEELAQVKMAAYDHTRIIIAPVTETGFKIQSAPDLESASSMDAIPDESMWFLHKKFFPEESGFSLPKAIVFGEDEFCFGGKCVVQDVTLRTFMAPYSVDEVLAECRAVLLP